jgi:molybdenum cofactor cytidylyltransferase
MSQVKPENVGAIILAAGNSKRMNSWKPFLKYDKDNTFIEKIVTTFLKWGCQEIVVVINKDVKNQGEYFDQLPKKVTYIINDHPEFERFYSVKLGMQTITKSDFCFIQNVDNPFISEDILDAIYQEKSHDSYVIPVFDNIGGHPVLLNTQNINFIRNHPENTANLRNVLGEFNSKKINMGDNRILININTFEEYDKFVIAKKV